jgi:hypothetical protein
MGSAVIRDSDMRSSGEFDAHNDSMTQIKSQVRRRVANYKEFE